jgi:hypothetical protein
MRKREEVLIVDGYNMIGAWPELERLKQIRLEDARRRLLDMLADYASFSGLKVVVVFDAFRVPGPGREYRHRRLQIVYTREKETADECIERLVGEWMSLGRYLYVATSDQTEQRVAFGRGALRVSARELRLAIDESRKEIDRALRREPPPKRNPLGSVLSLDVRQQFERWRRGEIGPEEEGKDGR